MSELLVVAGEASGDALAAEVATELVVATFGLGGPRLARAGLDGVRDVTAFAAMGVTAAAGRGPRLASALFALSREVRKRRPRAALLVGFSEVNALLAGWLKRRGTRVLWYAPPQVWAWRPKRARPIATNCDALAVLLPFETECWTRAGATVEYVGHPAAWRAQSDASRREVVLLPGSRAHEVRAHLLPMLGAAAELARDGLAARLVLAEGLDARTAAWVERVARARGVPVTRSGPDALDGAAAALVASGTATLECAAASVPPVIVYRTDPLTFAVAARLVRVPHVGLPNLVLDRRAFPELLQKDVTASRLAAAVRDVLAAPHLSRASCREVREKLRGPDDTTPAERVAATLRPWLT
ncbi:MAG TPA: hypothetical protein VH062_03785 [Polyangiaceae bacterium]|nr:hypothetical protein [Polyangiaceae bacterium]